MLLGDVGRECPLTDPSCDIDQGSQYVTNRPRPLGTQPRSGDVAARSDLGLVGDVHKDLVEAENTRVSITLCKGSHPTDSSGLTEIDYEVEVKL